MAKKELALVTGGAGLRVGSHPCEGLLAEGYRVICMDNLCTRSPENIAHLQADPDFEYVDHDVTTYISCPGSLRKKTSLDELPQLWNVLTGEMSLVGPRPMLEEEMPNYGKTYELYKRVPPGITGFWQASGRSDIGYEERLTTRQDKREEVRRSDFAQHAA